MNRPKSILLKLVMLFAVLGCLNTALVAYSAGNGLNSSLERILQEKSRSLTTNLSAVLGDPFSLGEYDHMQQILDAARRSDRDLSYAIVLSCDGRAVATTEAELKNLRLTRDDFERQALMVADFTIRTNPNNSRLFECVMPIRTARGQAGILRLGFSKARIDAFNSGVVAQAAIVGFLVLVVSSFVFAFLAKPLLNSMEQSDSSRLVS